MSEAVRALMDEAPAAATALIFITAARPPISMPISIVVEQLRTFIAPFLKSPSCCLRRGPLICAECSPTAKYGLIHRVCPCASLSRKSGPCM